MNAPVSLSDFQRPVHFVIGQQAALKQKVKDSFNIGVWIGVAIFLLTGVYVFGDQLDKTWVDTWGAWALLLAGLLILVDILIAANCMVKLYKIRSFDRAAKTIIDRHNLTQALGRGRLKMPKRQSSSPSNSSYPVETISTEDDDVRISVKTYHNNEPTLMFNGLTLEKIRDLAMRYGPPEPTDAPGPTA